MKLRLGWFGVVFALVTSQAVAQSGVVTARCEMRSVNAYGEPISGVAVSLRLVVPRPDWPGYWYPVAGADGSTDSNGYVFLSATASGATAAAICRTNAAASGYTLYPSEAEVATNVDDTTLSGRVVVLPRPVTTLPVGNGTMDLYRSGSYDKPLVVAEPFSSSETVEGPRTAEDLWMLYNGDPRLLAGGMLARLFNAGYDVWLFRPRRIGDDLNVQAADFARAVQNAYAHQSYGGAVAVAGYSMGGLVVRTAMARWNALGMPGTPPVNLIATLDSPLRGALLSNDLQHAFWNANGDDGQSAHDKNMDSCAAQQMLENACKKLVNCPTCLDCNDRGWYEMFYGGNSFTFCNPSQGSCWQPDSSPSSIKTCTGAGLLNLPNGRPGTRFRTL
jgi:hypothetical protein